MSTVKAHSGDMGANANGRGHFKVRDAVGHAVLQALGIINDDEGDQDSLEENQGWEEHDVRTDGGKLKGRGRRPNVQISEKEVVNGVPRVHAKTTTQKERGTSHQGRKSVISQRVSKQAAAAVEHTVVRGTNNGKQVIREIVHHKGPGYNLPALEEKSTGEHFGDPSNEVEDRIALQNIIVDDNKRIGRDLPPEDKRTTMLRMS